MMKSIQHFEMLLSLNGAPLLRLVIVAPIVLLGVLGLSLVVANAMAKRRGVEYTIAFWTIAAGISAMATIVFVLVTES